MKLHAGTGLVLPVESAVEALGCLGGRGSGKTNAARVLAEEMFKAKQPFVVLDPVGSWWGLRSNRAGDGPGIEIPIFGGKHGDLPLGPDDGAHVADLVVDHRMFLILDLSEFASEAAKKGFLLDFATRLYRRNEAPLHLFLEEADDYIPQKMRGGADEQEPKLLRAFENIVRRGRMRGLGMTMITQRSAVINKNVLTQVGTLFAFRTTGPQDRDAVAEWVKFHGQHDEIVASLAGLEDGECWIISPEFLGAARRARFRLSETYDSGRTPKPGERWKAPSTLADVDLGALRDGMKTAIEKAEAEDPKRLRAELAKTKALLAAAEKKGAAVPAPPAKTEIPADVRSSILDHAQRVGELLTLAEGIRDEVAGLAPLLASVQDLVREAGKVAAEIAPAMRAVAAADGRMKIPGRIAALAPAPSPLRPERPVRPVLGGGRYSPAAAPTSPSKADAAGLTGPERKILDALAFLESVGNPTPEKTAVAFVAGYSVNGGAFCNPMGRLRSAGLVEYEGGSVFLTEAGRPLAAAPDADLTTADLHARLLARLDGPGAKILRPLLEMYPRGMTNEELAAAVGYAPDGGAYCNPRGRLRTLGLIEYRNGEVLARSVLFPTGPA